MEDSNLSAMEPSGKGKKVYLVKYKRLHGIERRKARISVLKQIENDKSLQNIHDDGFDKRRGHENEVDINELSLDPPKVPKTSQPDKETPESKKNIKQIKLGKHIIEPLYFSPYPKELCKEPRIYICEFCLKYMASRTALERHLFKCHQTHRRPPGNEIYGNDDTRISLFEIDGEISEGYAQKLCLLAKLFMDAKNTNFDTKPFLFYVMSRNNDRGRHITGFFSQPKNYKIYNVSCLLVLPPYQQKGYGKFLIKFSYELSKRANKTGTPEKPLSDMGLRAYQSYWAEAVLDVLASVPHAANNTVSIDWIGKKTAIAPNDIMSTLKTFNFIHFINEESIMVIDPEVVKAHLSAKKSRKSRFHSKRLKWQPTM